MAATLNHTAPIFFAILAPTVLAERPNNQTMIAILVGFVGVVLLLHPDTQQSQIWGCSIGLIVGFLVAIGYLFIRRLGAAGEPESRTVFYYSLSCTIFSTAWAALIGIHPITFDNFWIISGLGVSATVGQLAVTRAYKTGKSMLTTSLTYVNVVFASLLGIALWNEVLPLISWIAFGLIISSGVLASTANLTKKQTA